MNRRASLLSRLALALFAALGFVAPIDRPEPSCAAQVTARALAPPSAAALGIAGVPVENGSEARLEVEPLAPRPSARPVGRRYLLHRAWLL